VAGDKCVETALRRILNGNSTHRAVILKGSSLFEKRKIIEEIIARSIEAEPHIFWQFILFLRSEEPLDLFDALIQTIKEVSKIFPHINERWIEFDTDGKICSRKLLLLLQRDVFYRKEWLSATKELLASCFY
jgi:hypothetical protein